MPTQQVLLEPRAQLAALQVPRAGPVLRVLVVPVVPVALSLVAMPVVVAVVVMPPVVVAVRVALRTVAVLVVVVPHTPVAQPLSR
ncbi:MAG: hypothetical protein ACRDWB_11165 [Acidimicrobiales bacterium]